MSIEQKGQKLVDLAEWIAEEAHQGQTRKFAEGEQPYIVHPRRVAALVREAEGIGKLFYYRQAAALLHDVFESTDVTTADLTKRGIPKEVINTLWRLTRRDQESYFHYIFRIYNNELRDQSIQAIAVKLADLEDNGSTLPKKGSLIDKYRLAYYILSKGLPPF